MLNFNHFFKTFKFKNSTFQEATTDFYVDCYREYLEKVWSKKNQNCRTSKVLKFSLLSGPMLTKISIFFFKFQNSYKQVLWGLSQGIFRKIWFEEL